MAEALRQVQPHKKARAATLQLPAPIAPRASLPGCATLTATTTMMYQKRSQRWARHPVMERNKGTTACPSTHAACLHVRRLASPAAAPPAQHNPYHSSSPTAHSQGPLIPHRYDRKIDIPTVISSLSYVTPTAQQGHTSTQESSSTSVSCICNRGC